LDLQPFADAGIFWRRGGSPSPSRARRLRAQICRRFRRVWGTQPLGKLTMPVPRCASGWKERSKGGSAMFHYRTMSLGLLAVLVVGMVAGFATAQTPSSPYGAPGTPGAPANPAPNPTTTGPTLFGMSPTSAVVVGLVLLLV